MSIFERHQRIALQFSGGKDSLACLYLLRDKLDLVTVYSLNAGDRMPETQAVIDAVRPWIPHFVEIRSDVSAWIDANGLPSDVVPTCSTWMGRVIGLSDTPIVDRFECCMRNVMLPMYERMKADGVTCIIRGQKDADMARRPLQSGDSIDGFEFYYPIEDWTHAQVFSYLKEVGAPISPVYETMNTSPECMKCSAWWDDGRAQYLKAHYPEAHAVYVGRLRVIRSKIAPHLENMNTEIG